ncbi:hypothetical protein BSR29_00780 [Boudabousia liubingyangii]|uniref:Glycosyltransferase family 1 protein n=1 Tax=Boudabousia liubingyangii TaxID=1921764 RepID=A0A1Q5PPP3_9ACTO|nr:hypothetical protein [Boudabousia liubingyangii]OKL49524.1 hypothetical protein BSR29_00780 [Boudabousia liubingyangii]
MITDYAQEHDRKWDLLTPPPIKLTPKGILERGRFDRNLLRLRNNYDLLHVHYGTNGYYLWGFKGPSLLHFHGTDARKNAYNPGQKQLIKKSIAEATAVVYSTLDLLPWMERISEEPVYLPNPAPKSIPLEQMKPVVENLIFFNTRWDGSKGGLALVKTAEELVQKGFIVHGMDWGNLAPLAKQSGVTLHPLASPQEFQALLSAAHVIVGQIAYPALTISDMMSLQTGRPLVMHPLLRETPALPALRQNLTTRVVTATQDSSEQRNADQIKWVEENHGIDKVFAKWDSLYQKL